MTEKHNSVLLPIPLPTQKSLRAAVAKIIRRVQLEAHLTDDDLADELGISVGTVRNARNEQTDLNATTIAKIGAKFGAEVLDPYAALYGARNVPIEASDADAMPSMTAAVHRLAVAQAPGSDGGARITHTELAAMLPELRAAIAALNSLVVRAERIAA